jgi:peptide/nickel transport system permease protein
MEQQRLIITISARKFKKNFFGAFWDFGVGEYWSHVIIPYVISSDDSQNANQMHLSIHSQHLGLGCKCWVCLRIENQAIFRFQIIILDSSDTSSDFRIYCKKMKIVYTEYASDSY